MKQWLPEELYCMTSLQVGFGKKFPETVILSDDRNDTNELAPQPAGW